MRIYSGYHMVPTIFFYGGKMIYRINIQHFLTEMIDYFPLEDLIDMQYTIISANISNGGRAHNVVKLNTLYPDTEAIAQYAETGDKNVLKKMYYNMLDEGKTKNLRSNTFHNIIYHAYVSTLLDNVDTTILCDKGEDIYIDCLCDYLKDRFNIEVIDLNQLFTKGKVGPIYLDRDKVRDKAVDIRRNALKEQIATMKQTAGGRSQLIHSMSKKDKLKELKRLNVKLNQDDMDHLDELLLEEWAEED